MVFQPDCWSPAVFGWISSDVDGQLTWTNAPLPGKSVLSPVGLGVMSELFISFGHGLQHPRLSRQVSHLSFSIQCVGFWHVPTSLFFPCKLKLSWADLDIWFLSSHTGSILKHSATQRLLCEAEKRGKRNYLNVILHKYKIYFSLRFGFKV